jgi:hypothetical protein
LTLRDPDGESVSVNSPARFLLMLCATAGVLAFPASALAGVAGGLISSDGPLTRVETTSDLGCGINHELDGHGEFYGDTACGTLVAVGGSLYGPASIPAGSATGTRIPWTAESQVGSGAGTAVNPYRAVTTVSGGGLRLVQTDTYVTGVESYGTRVAITNISGGARSFTLYRAADCYLQDDDHGYGAVDNAAGSVSCVTGTDPGSRIEQWAPLTPGSHYLETVYSSLWAAIGAQEPFNDTCDCGTREDNAAGLSWSATLAAGSTASFAHLTAFSPQGTTQVADSDGDGFPDSWEAADGGVDTNNDGTPDLKLSDFGATPDRPDVFLQVNWTQTRHCTLLFFCSETNRRPALAAMRDIQNAYKRHGLRLHIDAGPDSVMNPDTGATWGSRSAVGAGVEAPKRLAGYNASTGDLDWTAAFDLLRVQLLPKTRARIFHFALYIGDFDDAGHSGVARQASSDGMSGRDLVFAYDVPYFHGNVTRIAEAGTLMHELGHNLGLTHGGSWDDAAVNGKPNYPSIMNYVWQSTGVPKYDHLGLLDYSDGTLGLINENALSEHDGLGPDNVASDIGLSWVCGETKKGPAPSVFDVDWNCNGRIDGGTVAADVNGDGARTALADHDDWSSLVFDGGGALGGAGDAAAAVASAPVDEPDNTQLERARRDLHTVELTGPGVLSIQSKTAAPVKLTIANHYDAPRTYSLTTTANGVTLGGVPAQVTLAPQERRTLTATLTAGTANASAFFEVDADSGDITDADSAVTDVAVVDQDVPDQPGKVAPPLVGKAPAPTGGVAVIADSSRAFRVAIGSGRAARLSAHAVGKVGRLAAGTHSVRVVEVVPKAPKGHKRAKARVATVRVKLASRQLQALVVSVSGHKLKVKVVKVAGGKRAMLSLLSGTRSVRLGTAKKAKVRRVRRGSLVTLAQRRRCGSASSACASRPGCSSSSSASARGGWWWRRAAQGEAG